MKTSNDAGSCHNEIAIEIEDSSDDEEEEITSDMILKPTLYHLAPTDLASVQNKNHLMRGTCVQAIIELLHSEKRREDLTCVSTDFYPLLMEHNFTQAKRLLHPDEGCEADRNNSWNVPHNRIANAQSRTLMIPCHTGNHWFLTLRIKQKEGKHQVIIIDSLGQMSGNKNRPEIMSGLKRMKLIKKKDRCIIIDTKIQTEVECGVRMLAYMILFRSMDLQNMRSAQIIERINSQATKEKGFHGDLAERRRRHVHNVLQKEQEKNRK